jgi:hypothetical protein
MNTPYTEEQKRQFREQFKSRRTRQLMVSLPLVAVVLGASFLRSGKPEQIAGISVQTLGLAFFFLMVGVLIFSLRNWRCPACDRYLGRSISPRFCPKCGVELG